VTCFGRDSSCHIETPTSLFYKEVYKQRWYQKGLLIAPSESHKEYLQMSLQGYSALTCCHEHEPQKPRRRVHGGTCCKDFVAWKAYTIGLSEAQGTHWNMIKCEERLGIIQELS
jgi:hypothetical protein